MRTRRVAITGVAIASVAAVLASAATLVGRAQGRTKAPTSPRLYIFDCGVIKGLGVDLFGFKKDEVPVRDFFVPCYLVAHPKGTLMWEVGVVPDSAFKADGAPVTEGVSTVARPLLPQLAAVGYTPADITYLSMSHYHSDHTANANALRQIDVARAAGRARRDVRDAAARHDHPGGDVLRAQNREDHHPER